MTKNVSQLKQLICISLAILFVCLFISCEKNPDDLGLNILPGQDNLSIQLDSSAVIMATTVKLDSILAYDTIYYTRESLFVGDSSNPFFGKTKSSVIINFLPDSASYNFGSDAIADSLVMTMRLDSIFGNANGDLELKIWELKKPFNVKGKYYTNLKEEDFKGDLVAVKNVKYNDTLKVKLDMLLASRILKIEPSEDENDAAMYKFLNEFKGLYIEARSLSNEPLFISFDPWRHSTYLATYHETHLKLYYRNGTDTTEFNYFPRIAFNKTSHEYSNTTILSAMQDQSFGQKVTYVHGMGGLATRINIPNLSKWGENGPVAINKAQLVIPVANIPEVPENLHPKRLYIKAVKSGINDLDFIEYGFGQTFLNGTYDSEKKAYIFNLAKHIQKIANSRVSLSPTVQNTDLLIMADGYKIGQRNSFSHAGLNFSGAKLYIVYSKQ